MPVKRPRPDEDIAAELYAREFAATREHAMSMLRTERAYAMKLLDGAEMRDSADKASIDEWGKGKYQ